MPATPWESIDRRLGNLWTLPPRTGGDVVRRCRIPPRSSCGDRFFPRRDRALLGKNVGSGRSHAPSRCGWRIAGGRVAVGGFWRAYYAGRKKSRRTGGGALLATNFDAKRWTPTGRQFAHQVSPLGYAMVSRALASEASVRDWAAISQPLIITPPVTNIQLRPTRAKTASAGTALGAGN